ncbi:hypothetical protein V8E55_008511 [Tylopilus felleus]
MDNKPVVHKRVRFNVPGAFPISMQVRCTQQPMTDLDSAASISQTLRKPTKGKKGKAALGSFRNRQIGGSAAANTLVRACDNVLVDMLSNIVLPPSPAIRYPGPSQPGIRDNAMVDVLSDIKLPDSPDMFKGSIDDVKEGFLIEILPRTPMQSTNLKDDAMMDVLTDITLPLSFPISAMDSPSPEAEANALVDILIGIDIPSSPIQLATGSLNPRLEDNVVSDVKMLGPIHMGEQMLNKAARARQITRLTCSLNHNDPTWHHVWDQWECQCMPIEGIQPHMFSNSALLAKHFGRNPMLQYPSMAVDEARQADIKTAGRRFLMYSRERRDLVMEQWELLQLLDVMLSKSW